MSAKPGDRIRQHANTAGGQDRVGTIEEVLGEGGEPPYRVRYDSGEESIVTPGPDAVIKAASWAERAEAFGEQAAQRTGEKAREAWTAAREQGGPKAREAYETARERGTESAGKAARAVSQAADKIAKRFER